MLNKNIRLRLQRATGLDLAPAAIAGAVRRRMKDCGTADHEAYAHRVLYNDDELNALIDLLVVPETWFFRDADAFTAVIGFAQKKLAETRGPLRLLSVPCATGEEPGSLAMALLDAGIGASHFTIEAIDVSQQAIEQARRGIYHRNAFRTADLAFRDRHFIKLKEGYELSAEVRAQVQSRCGNLLTIDEPAPGAAFDIIFCRNLLIYFDETTQHAAIRKLDTLLADGGLLFVGYAEAPTFCRHGFAMAPFPKAFALTRKRTGSAAEPPPCRPTPRAKPQPPRVRKTTTFLPPLAQQPAAVRAADAPEMPEALLQQARQLADAGKIDDACAKYHACLQAAPDSAEAYFMLGLLSEHTNATEAAGEYLRRAVYLDPGHYDALCHLALLAERDGNARGAAGFRQRAARVFRRRFAEANK